MVYRNVMALVDAMTFLYTINWLMPWHFYTLWIGWCHDISIHHELVDAMTFLFTMNWLMSWHFCSPWIGWCHDISIHHELVDAMTFLYTINWLMSWYFYPSWIAWCHDIQFMVNRNVMTSTNSWWIEMSWHQPIHGE
jgi:hypothetical protein